MGTKYYEITDLERTGKRENGIDYLFDAEKGWVRDTKHVISDRLNGFDDSGDAGDPYSYGSSDMLFRIWEISEEEAEKRTENR